ncbi:hypothetical protein [Undibacterium sp. TJN19]|uniref:hypothetical protein n=1 Tax=Undibacterium sp. TJN19 TaxID=3413055 RepID=UPI003BF14345
MISTHANRDHSHIHQRTDFHTAEHVNTGLHLQSTVGTLCALEFMKTRGVPNQVTERVLLQPQKCRLHG